MLTPLTFLILYFATGAALGAWISSAWVKPLRPTRGEIAFALVIGAFLWPPIAGMLCALRLLDSMEA